MRDVHPLLGLRVSFLGFWDLGVRSLFRIKDPSIRGSLLKSSLGHRMRVCKSETVAWCEGTMLRVRFEEAVPAVDTVTYVYIYIVTCL